MESLRKKLNISEKVWRILEFVAYGLLALFIAYIIITYVGQRTVVDGDSMYPSLENGDNIIVEEFQKGYTYRDSVVRYSMVKVAN